MESTRKELRNEFYNKVFHEEFDSEMFVNRYTLWLEQKIIDLKRESKLHQPTVINAVCNECQGSGWEIQFVKPCRKCKGKGKQTDL